MHKHWEKFPYWIKGGIVSFSFGVVLLGSLFVDDMSEGGLFDWLRFALLMPFASGALFFAHNELLGIVEQMTLYVALGSLFGWIYGKIKK